MTACKPESSEDKVYANGPHMDLAHEAVAPSLMLNCVLSNEYIAHWAVAKRASAFDADGRVYPGK